MLLNQGENKKENKKKKKYMKKKYNLEVQCNNRNPNITNNF